MNSENRFLYTKIVWYIVIATVTIFLINMMSLARYSSDAEIYTDLELATPILEITSLTSSLTDLDSDAQEISFKIKNYKYSASENANIYNDVTLKYKIKFVAENGTPLVCNLYKVVGGVRSEIALTNNETTDNLILQHTNEQVDEYVVSVKVVDGNYAGTSDNVKILVDSEQVVR